MNKIIVESPGRINLIGEHVDYNGGSVLPAAIDKKIIIEFNSIEGNVCSIESVTVGKSFKLNLEKISKSTIQWENYIIGVLHNLIVLKKRKIGAFNCKITSNLPIGAGISSSSSLICGLISGLNYLNNLKLGSNEIVDMVSSVEHNFIGLMGGIMDQFTIVNGKKNNLILLNCQNRRFEYINSNFNPYKIILINTNVEHNLADSSYNQRVKECQEALEIINKNENNYKYLVDVELNILNKFKDSMNRKVYNRAKFVIEENKRTHDSSVEISKSNIKEFGKLMYQSHKGLRELYEVSCEELDFLVDFSKSKKEVIGSRMMGGGFGGCTINLIRDDYVDDFLSSVSKAYLKKFNIEPSPLFVNIGDGVTIKTT
jgi:galactokinase